eukprot:GHVU01192055.1.p1 GENE.GHVU01192055.1~~GHVU01192055.1.p1  ORF type:complete len:146 (-),score=6.27 GHVU01192055.1:617-1054(-)
MTQTGRLEIRAPHVTKKYSNGKVTADFKDHRSITWRLDTSRDIGKNESASVAADSFQKAIGVACRYPDPVFLPQLLLLALNNEHGNGNDTDGNVVRGLCGGCLEGAKARGSRLLPARRSRSDGSNALPSRILSDRELLPSEENAQ